MSVDKAPHAKKREAGAFSGRIRDAVKKNFKLPQDRQKSVEGKISLSPPDTELYNSKKSKKWDD